MNKERCRKKYMQKYRWHRYTIAESFDRLTKAENLWFTFGDFSIIYE